MKLLYPERPKELDETLRAYVWRRLQFVQGRFRPRIKWVRVYIDNTEENKSPGPYGSKKQNIMVSKNGNPWMVS